MGRAGSTRGNLLVSACYLLAARTVTLAAGRMSDRWFGPSRGGSGLAPSAERRASVGAGREGARSWL